MYVRHVKWYMCEYDQQGTVNMIINPFNAVIYLL